MPEERHVSPQGLDPHQPIACFHPTPEELELLARDHMETWYSYEWGARVGGCFGSQDGLRQARLDNRITEIEQVIGEDRVSKVIDPIKEYWRALFKEVEDLRDFRKVNDTAELDVNDPLYKPILARAGVIVVGQHSDDDPD